MSTIIAGNFNIPASAIDISRQEVSKNREYVYDLFNHNRKQVMKGCQVAARAAAVLVAPKAQWSGVIWAAPDTGQRQLCIGFAAEPLRPIIRDL